MSHLKTVQPKESTDSNSSQKVGLSPEEQYRSCIQYLRVMIELPLFGLGCIAAISPFLDSSLRWYLAPLGVIGTLLVYKEMTMFREVNTSPNVLDQLQLKKKLQELFTGNQRD